MSAIDVRWAIAVSVAITCVAGGAHAEDCPLTEIAGRIESVSGTDANSTAVVTRSSGVRVPVAPFLVLCDGDRLDLTGKAAVTAVVDRDVHTYTASTDDRVLHGGLQTTFGPSAPRTLLARLDEMWRAILVTSRKAIPVYVNTRGAGPVEPPRPDPLLPVGEQDLPPGSRRLALVWRKGNGTVDVSPASQPPFSIQSGYRAFAVFDVPPDGKDFGVALRGQPIAWSVKYVAGPPAPPGVEAASIRSPGDRLIRALWILGSGPVQWHAFALSEIADLAGSGSFAADQIWTAVRSGEVSDALATRPVPGP